MRSQNSLASRCLPKAKRLVELHDNSGRSDVTDVNEDSNDAINSTPAEDHSEHTVTRNKRNLTPGNQTIVKSETDSSASSLHYRIFGLESSTGSQGTLILSVILLSVTALATAQASLVVL